MSGVLFWLYPINSILIISHEIDSAYWREWELFKIPGGRAGFLLLHFPLLFFILYGLVLLSMGSRFSLVFLSIVCLGGIFAYSVHSYFLKKGRTEFDESVSRIILVLTGLVSVVQLAVTLYFMVA